MLTQQCTHHVCLFRPPSQFRGNNCSRSPSAMAAPSSPAFTNINPMLFFRKYHHENVGTNLPRVASASRNDRGVTRDRPSRGHGTRRDSRQESHCAVGGAEDGLEGGSRAGSEVRFLKDAKRGDSSGDSFMDPGGMAAARGMEPAVKGCGVMTTATFLQLVR